MTTYKDLIISDGPVCYLPMQDGIVSNGGHPTDAMGTFTPTTTGTFTDSASGPTINTIVNRAYACAGGAGNNISLRATPIIRGLTNWTIEMWVKVTTPTTPYSFYMERSTVGGNQDITGFSTIGGAGQIACIYRDDSGHLTYSLANQGAGSGSAAGMTLSSGVWTYVVGVKSGTLFLNYINGALGYSYQWATSSSDTQTEASVPAWLFNDQISDASVAGSMAHAAIYTKALSAATVTSHWNNSQAAAAPSTGTSKYHANVNRGTAKVTSLGAGYTTSGLADSSAATISPGGNLGTGDNADLYTPGPEAV